SWDVEDTSILSGVRPLRRAGVAPGRYRFDVSGPVPRRPDVLVRQDPFHLVPVVDSGADATFCCNMGNCLLRVYGRVSLDQAVNTGRLDIEGNREQTFFFHTLFQGV